MTEVNPNPIEFRAIVYKVQTLVDNGIRVTFDLPEQAIMEVAQLMELKRLGAALQLSVRWSVGADFGRPTGPGE